MDVSGLHWRSVTCFYSFCGTVDREITGTKIFHQVIFASFYFRSYDCPTKIGIRQIFMYVNIIVITLYYLLILSKINISPV